MSILSVAALRAVAHCNKDGGIIINEHTLTSAETVFHARILASYFDIIKLEDLAARMAHTARRPFCILTFDDGKRSNYTQSAPQLERLGIPAAFYVTVGPVTTGASFWFDRRNRLLRALGHCPDGLELDTLKKLNHGALMQRLNEACAAYGIAVDRGEDERPMSWSDVRCLSRRGFAIGAHGVSHAILTRECTKRAHYEIEESIARVCAEVGSPCTSFAFPNGSYNAELVEFAASRGANTVMTTDPGWVNRRTHLRQLPRIQLFGGSSRSRIELKIALAAFRGVLQNPNGNRRSWSSVTTTAGLRARLHAELEVT